MRLRSFPQTEARVFFSPDDPAGGGGDDEKFTKEQVEQMIQGRIAKMKQDQAVLQKQLTDKEAASAAKLAELEAKLAELKPAGDPPPSDLEGRLKLLESRHAKELEALTSKITTVEKEREREKNLRMKAERDSELQAALRKGGCRADAEGVAASYFQNQIAYDEEDQRWVYNLRKGGTCTVEEGVAEEMPDYLKEPTMQRGGSGSSSGAKGAKNKQLEEAKAKLEALKKAAVGGRDDTILQYQNQKRIVGQLELELAQK